MSEAIRHGSTCSARKPRGGRLSLAAALACLTALCLLLSTVHFGGVSITVQPHGFGHWPSIALAPAQANACQGEEERGPEQTQRDDAPAKKRRTSLLCAPQHDDAPGPLAPAFASGTAVASTRARVAPTPWPAAANPVPPIPARQRNRGQAPPPLA